jgi:hypothetical protein
VLKDGDVYRFNFHSVSLSFEKLFQNKIYAQNLVTSSDK